jgi:sugar phosphate isomerase/epimerase
LDTLHGARFPLVVAFFTGTAYYVLRVQFFSGTHENYRENRFMKLGICGGPDLAPAAAEAGFDFLEWTVGALLRPREDEDAFAAALASVKQAPLPCPIVNCFIPGNLKITGPAADLAALRAYATTAFRRAERAGVSVIVFGSGGARQVPPETPMARATDQVVEFCRMLGPLADAHGVTVAVEPLNRTE